jgi:radical SAM protein with 4Fe4S-binding SPASM domain
MGVEIITLKTMSIYSNNPDIHSWRRVYIPKRDDTILEEASRIAKSNGIFFDANEFLSTKVESEKDEHKLQNPEQILTQELGTITPMCFQPFKTFYVRADGDVRPCCFSRDGTSLGNLHKQDMKEIWDGEPYRQLREGVLNGKYPKDCENCLKYNIRPKHDDTDDIFRQISSSRVHKTNNTSIRAPL